MGIIRLIAGSSFTYSNEESDKSNLDAYSMLRKNALSSICDSVYGDVSDGINKVMGILQQPNIDEYTAAEIFKKLCEIKDSMRI